MPKKQLIIFCDIFPAEFGGEQKWFGTNFRESLSLSKFVSKLLPLRISLKAQLISHLEKEMIKWKNLIWIYHQQNLNLGITGITKENWSLTFALKTDTAPHLKCEKHQEFTIFRNTVAQILKNIARGTIVFFSHQAAHITPKNRWYPICLKYPGIPGNTRV